MSDITTIFLVDETETDSAVDEHSLSPLVKVFVIVALSLAAWVPVALPLILLFDR
jgi:hypothetical protein